MEKGYTTQETAPPYPGPPVNYGGEMPPPGMYPQPNFSTSPAGPPPFGYQGDVPGAPVTFAPTVTHMVVTPVLQDVPGQAVCQNCRQSGLTEIELKSGLMTWAICGGLFIFGCCLCSCIPFCVDSCKDVEHRCPTCHNVIHIHKRL